MNGRRWFLFGRRREDDLEREIAFHLEQHVADLVAGGMSPDEARRQARMALGGVEQVKEECRDERPTRWLQDLWRDLCHAFRVFGQNPGTTAVALLSLALAMGPNAALFGIVDRVFLRPVMVPDSSRLFFINIRADANQRPKGLDEKDFQELRERAADLGDFAAVTGGGLRLDVGGVVRLVSYEGVSGRFFEVLKTGAAMGRLLDERDGRSGGPTPVVLSDALWRREFAAADDILGRVIILDTRPHVVVGITRPGFREPMQHLVPTDVWTPLEARRSDVKRYVDVLIRLPEGRDTRSVGATLQRIGNEIWRQKVLVLRPVEDRGRVVIGGLILMLVSLVLLIACVNVAIVLLSQGEARQREFAIRRALGASRGRLLRQSLAETLVLALGASALALLLAHWLLRAVPSVLPQLPFTFDLSLHVGGPLLLYSLALTLMTTLAAGLVPAIRTSRSEGRLSPASAKSRFRGVLILAQIACAEFLLVGTALIAASYFRVLDIRPGFDVSRNVMFVMFLPRPGQDYQAIADRVRGLPGVRRVVFVREAPLSGSGTGGREVTIPGVTDEPASIPGSAAGAEYFTTLGARVLAGRDFSRSDSESTAIINDEMARRLWGSASDAVGRSFRVDGKDRLIVGVVETGKYTSLVESPMPFFYTFTDGRETLLVEIAGSAMPVAADVRRLFQQSFPGTGAALAGDAPRTTRAVAVPVAFRGRTVCHLGTAGNSAGGTRTLRRRVPRRHPALARDRGADGTGCPTRRCPATGAPRRPGDGRGRHADRHGGGGVGGAFSGGRSIWSESAGW